MFTNPLNRKYQAGGPTPTDDERKDMKGFITWIKSNVEGFKDKSVEEIAQSISDMAKSEEGKKSVQELYSKYQKSKKQKTKLADGGKMQYFICKHSRGGNVDCGCGGMVVRAEPGMQLPERRVRRASSRNMEDAPDTGYVTRRRVGYADVDGNRTVYEDAVVDGTSAQTWVTSDGQGGYKVAQRIPIQGGWRDVEYNPDTWQYKAITGRLADYFNRPVRTTKSRVAPIIGLFPGSTKSGEINNTLADGGIISEQVGGPILTRRQARELSGLNRGYSRSDFQTAMANARLGLRNEGLRGRALRQAARNMVAGIQPTTVERQNLTDNTVPEIVVNPTIQQAATLAELPTREQPTNTNRRRRDYAQSGDYNTNVDTNVVLDIPVVTSEGLTGRKNRFTGLRRQVVPTQSIQTSPTYSDSVYTNPNVPAGGWSPERMREDIYQFGPGVPWERAGLIEEPEKPTVIDWSKSSTWDPYIRMNNGPLSPYQMELIRVLTANPNATINDLRGGWTPETFAAAKQKFGFKCGGKVEKHQDANGKIYDRYIYPEDKNGASSEHILTPGQHFSLYKIKSEKVPGKVDSLFVFGRGRGDMIGPTVVNRASRLWINPTKAVDNIWWTNGIKASPFNSLRSEWESYKTKSIPKKK